MIENSFIVSASINVSSNSISIVYDNSRTYDIDSEFIMNKMRITDFKNIYSIEIGMNGSELILHTSAGEIIFPWDFILCYFEPEYKYYSS